MKKLQGEGGGGRTTAEEEEDTLHEDCCDLEMGKLKEHPHHNSPHQLQESVFL